MAESQLSWEEVIYTTRAMRRLKPDPIPDEVLKSVIEAATQAASAENSQRWAFVVVRDPGTRKRVSEVYLRIAAQSVRPGAEGEAPADEAEVKVYKNAWRMAQRFADIPALVVMCMRGDLPSDRVWTSTYYGSVYPAVQNLMLAARGHGLGSVLTTLHLIDEAPIKEALGIPANVHTEAIIPLGYPEGEWRRPVRRPVDEVTHWDRWGGKP